MPNEFYSDLQELPKTNGMPSANTVGEARDLIEGKLALARPIEVHAIAKSINRILYLGVSADRRKVDMPRGVMEPQLTLGQAEDFLKMQLALMRPRKVLRIARGLRELLHREWDYTIDGLVVLLPEEIERRAKLSDEFLNMPARYFPEEDRRLLEEG